MNRTLILLPVLIFSCNIFNSEDVAKKEEPIPTEIPLAPSDLFAVSDSAGSILLTWTDNSDNEAGFIIKIRGGKDIETVYIDSTLKNITSYRISGLDELELYSCDLKAYNIIGESGCLTSIHVKVNPEYPLFYKINLIQVGRLGKAPNNVAPNGFARVYEIYIDISFVYDVEGNSGGYTKSIDRPVKDLRIYTDRFNYKTYVNPGIVGIFSCYVSGNRVYSEDMLY